MRKPDIKKNRDKREWMHWIDTASHEDLCYLARFASVGNIVFMDRELYRYFREKYTMLGGMTPEMSNIIDEIHEQGG